jgi:hypothetical protein
VVLLVADDKALNTFSDLQAFWHPYFAQAIRGAQLGGAKVVAMDIAFGIPVEKWAPGNDALLADAMASAQVPVVVGLVPGLLTKQKAWPKNSLHRHFDMMKHCICQDWNRSQCCHCV